MRKNCISNIMKESKLISLSSLKARENESDGDNVGHNVA